MIMFSSITERGAAVTLEALALGANDYVTKPSNTGNMTVALQRVREELIPRIKDVLPLTVDTCGGACPAEPANRACTCVPLRAAASPTAPAPEGRCRRYRHLHR